MIASTVVILYTIMPCAMLLIISNQQSTLRITIIVTVISELHSSGLNSHEYHYCIVSCNRNYCSSELFDQCLAFMQLSLIYYVLLLLFNLNNES